MTPSRPSVRRLMPLLCLLGIVAFAHAAEPKKKSNDPWKTTWVNPPAKPLPTKHYEATWFTDHIAAMKAAAK